MFGNSKPLASLSSGLLARKGQARPAMRPQGFVGINSPLEDLGWNDLGEAQPRATIAPLTPETPVPDTAPEPAVIAEREALSREVKASLPDVAASVVEAPQLAAALSPRKGRAAFTLRLDAERHLKLRLASAIEGRSAQLIVTQALDAYLDKLAEVEALSAQIRPGDGNR
ncbi:hypothetical protein COC42_01580 [Sphingomonas spermidinifaciens]|uniref:Uncharacterized protein n=1 Tax=Sphingomonas spermidinifaciens TaxID=1141889 RepID=A0A2A4B5V0_9SPHN|nr:hypothetical protein [Sphingomonas spermidinifaciens]PCD03138.1 hypothetical protein COC42_01580 [Sphingomonas spermidinifaciens]